MPTSNNIQHLLAFVVLWQKEMRECGIIMSFMMVIEGERHCYLVIYFYVIFRLVLFGAVWYGHDNAFLFTAAKSVHIFRHSYFLCVG